MPFQWVQFCESYSVPFVTSGPNVSRGHIAVKCPMCGAQDPSQHMSLNLTHGGWSCFRNKQHRGSRPAYLVAALANTTLDRARTIVGDSVFIPEDFMGAVRAALEPAVAAKHTPLKMPDEFKSFSDKPSCRHFLNYLTGPTRLFTREQALVFTHKWGLHYCTTGAYKGRIIFPIYFEGELVSWTGRTIYPDVIPRYKTLSVDSEFETTHARGPINDYLLFYDDLMVNKWDCDAIVLCEGPFDALRVRVLGRPYGIEATCFFTASPSRAQIDLLHDLVHRYPQRFLLLDQGTLATALRAQSDMAGLKLRALTLPPGLKDPGTITQKQLLALIP